MVVTFTLDKIVPDYGDAKRKQSEVYRQYKANLESIEDGEIEIIPNQDERLNYLSAGSQDWIIKLNYQIRDAGDHIGENKFRVEDEDTLSEIEEELDSFVSSLRFNIEPTWEVSFQFIVMFALFILYILFVMVTGEVNPFLWVAKQL